MRCSATGAIIFLSALLPGCFSSRINDECRGEFHEYKAGSSFELKKECTLYSRGTQSGSYYFLDDARLLSDQRAVGLIGGKISAEGELKVGQKGKVDDVQAVSFDNYSRCLVIVSFIDGNGNRIVARYYPSTSRSEFIMKGDGVRESPFTLLSR